MKKIAFLSPVLGFLFATVAFAYLGIHNFTGLTTTTSDGHTFKSKYNSTGSFPFNGQGIYDRSKVNLKGTYTLFEKDGIPVNQAYCVVLTGNLRTTGGKLTATAYQDITCSQVAYTEVFAVVSYSEDSTGNFTVVAKDDKGVVSTTSGAHQYTP